MPNHRESPPLGLSVLVIAAALAFGTSPHLAGDDGGSADDLIVEFRDAVYNQRLSESDIRTLHADTLSRIGSSGLPDAEALRAEALAHYYLGRFFQAIPDRASMAAYAEDLREGRLLKLRRYYTRRDAAMAAYGDARSAAEAHLERVDGAEAHRLYGEILGQMLFLGGVDELFSIGTKAKREVRTALDMDPDHPKARIQEASRLAYSPEGYGGDPDGAREIYRAVLRSGDIDREDEFNIYGGFGMAAFAEGRDEDAVSWFRAALALYPGNVFAAGMIDFLVSVREDSS